MPEVRKLLEIVALSERTDLLLLAAEVWCDEGRDGHSALGFGERERAAEGGDG